jgi:CRISPR-associated protein (TIGR02584 family)
MKRNILLCVAGMTPQIITETLYALHLSGEPIDEIRVITTLEGRNHILRSLLDENSGKFYEFCRDFGIDAESIKFDETTIALLGKPDGTTLEDIRTPEENVLAGDRICEIVAELCRDENARIHASAAGGRKTMSIYLTAAMQLFGRARDTLSHVLVNENFESHPQFFYPPPKPQTLKLRDGREISTAEAKIYLAPIPFIRLRGVGLNVFNDSARSYKKAVDAAQKELEFLESASEIRLNLKKRTIRAADREIKLPLRGFFVYVLFAYFRKKNLGENGFVSFRKIEREHLEIVCRLISQAFGDECGFDDFDTLPRASFIYNLDVASWRQKKNFSVAEAREKTVDQFRQICGKLSPAFQKANMEKFDIVRRGEKERYIFGLEIESEKIKFE